MVGKNRIKFFAVILVGLALGAVAKRQLISRHPSLVLEETNIDLGVITTSDPPRELRISIGNTGDAPLDLQLTGTSCGCLEATIPEPSISPGASDAIILRIDPHGESPGPNLQKVLLTTNDPDRSLVRLDVRWRVASVEEVTWLPREIDLPVSFNSYRKGDVFPGSQLTCIVIDSWQANLEIISVTHTDALTRPRVEDLTYGCSDPSVPQTGHAYRLTTSLRQDLMPGKYTESLSIFTNHPNHRRIDIPLNVVILPDIEAVPATSIARRHQGIVTREITVRSLADAPLQDPKSEWANLSFVTAHWSRMSESSFRLTVRVDTESPLLPGRFTLPVFSSSSSPDIGLSFRILPD